MLLCNAQNVDAHHYEIVAANPILDGFQFGTGDVKILFDKSKCWKGGFGLVVTEGGEPGHDL